MRPILLLVAFLFAGSVFASGSIIHATRKLRMSHTEALAPKDFYLDLGNREGIRAGDKLEVQRNLTVPDSRSDGSVRTLPVVLGTLQVIAVGETSSIAREVTLAPIVSLPAMQYVGFMVGDEVLVKTGLPTPLPLP